LPVQFHWRNQFTRLSFVYLFIGKNMKQLQRGEFFGQTNSTIHLDGITLTDTEYTNDYVDWHYHENAYFTFILRGNVVEGNRKEVYTCSAGSLLFHHWQEAHYNIKPPGFTRGFHIEMEAGWFDKYSLDIDRLKGSINISNPAIKLLLYKIFRETKINDSTGNLAVQTLLMQCMNNLSKNQMQGFDKKPQWVDKVKSILHEECSSNITLEYLVRTLGIHPVHLSRSFAKYFHCGMGEYIRQLRIEKSLALMNSKDIQLTEIAFDCGFSDQSHFNRCFKEIMGIHPLAYRKLLKA
jgi:AraC family transcriptional regulator